MFNEQELLMNIRTDKIKAIGAEVGLSDCADPDAIIAAAKARNYTWKQFVNIIGDAHKAFASISGNVAKAGRLFRDFEDLIRNELIETDREK